MSNVTPVLLTRPVAQSTRFADELRLAYQGQIEVTISPVLEIEFIDTALDLAGVAAAVFTSESGVRGFVRNTGRRDMTAYCVGARTAAAAQAEGFDAISADGDVGDLRRLLRSAKLEGPVFHARGEHVAGDLADAALGVEIRQQVVYQQRAKSLNEVAKKLLSGQNKVIVPFFSSRSAELFQAQLTDVMAAPKYAICLSQSVADQLDPTRFVDIILCREPNSTSMIGALNALLSPRHA